MRRPWVWLTVAATGFVFLFILALMAVLLRNHDPNAPLIVVGMFLLIFGSAGLIVGLIGAVICCFLKPKTLDLPYASRARGFEVTRSDK